MSNVLREHLRNRLWHTDIGSRVGMMLEPAGFNELLDVLAELAMDSGTYAEWYHGQQASIKRMDAQLSGCTGQVSRRPKRVKT